MRRRLAYAGFIILGCSGRGEVLRAGVESGGSNAGVGNAGAGNAGGGSGPVVLQQTEVRLSAGQDHACVVIAGKLSCWGKSDDGELGAPLGSNNGPRVVQIGSAVRAPAAGDTHTCVLDTQGNVYCFGANNKGQLGSNDFAASATPKLVALRAPAVDLQSGFDTTCALLSDASLWCWGYNWEGNLGLGDTHPGTDHSEPVQVGTDQDWTFVSTGQGHTCGIRSPGALYCWGRNTAYNIGQGSTDPEQYRSPTRVGTDGDWVEVSAGQSHSCARKRSGALYCWGNSGSGALGVGDKLFRGTPTRVPNIEDWQSVSTNFFDSCGVRRTGEVWCAGRNTEGMITGTNLQDAVPDMQRYGSDSDWAEVRVGHFFTCARKLDDSVWCAGKNDSGQISSDSTLDRSNTLLKITL